MPLPVVVVGPVSVVAIGGSESLRNQLVLSCFAEHAKIVGREGQRGSCKWRTLWARRIVADVLNLAA